MRIIAGRFRGRRLTGLKGAALRPTSDSLRETLFNVLGPEVAGARVLDAFAGTGALGLEALSRGAREVTFVERDPAALRVLAVNVDRCLAAEACAIIRSDFLADGDRLLARGQFDLVLLDPPYAVADFDTVLTAAGKCVARDGCVVLEHSRRRTTPESSGRLRRTRLLVAGDSALSFYSATAP
jgi:16S rRNA (guanine(966)-N(2))-methyltransferase RsmD